MAWLFGNRPRHLRVKWSWGPEAAAATWELPAFLLVSVGRNCQLWTKFNYLICKRANAWNNGSSLYPFHWLVLPDSLTCVSSCIRGFLDLTHQPLSQAYVSEAIVTGNLSYTCNWEIFESSTLIDLQCPFIDMGQLCTRTRMRGVGEIGVGEVLRKISQDPSVSKSNSWQCWYLLVFLYLFKVTFIGPVLFKWLAICLKYGTWHSYSSSSTTPSLTSSDGISTFVVANTVWTESVQKPDFINTTPIIPIIVCYYVELRNAVMSYSGVRFLLTKVQLVVRTFIEHKELCLEKCYILIKYL